MFISRSHFNSHISNQRPTHHLVSSHRILSNVLAASGVAHWLSPTAIRGLNAFHSGGVGKCPTLVSREFGQVVSGDQHFDPLSVTTIPLVVGFMATQWNSAAFRPFNEYWVTMLPWSKPWLPLSRAHIPTVTRQPKPKPINNLENSAGFALLPNSHLLRSAHCREETVFGWADPWQLLSMDRISLGWAVPYPLNEHLIVLTKTLVPAF